MDGPSAQGFLSLTGPLAPRVADCRSAAMLIKSALRDWLSVSYGLIGITVISHLRWLSPLWCLTAPKGECIPLAHRAVVKVLYKLAPYKFRGAHLPPLNPLNLLNPGAERRLNPQALPGLSIRRLYGFSLQRRHKKWRPKGRHTFPAGTVSQPIGKPFNGQAKGLLWLTWRSYAGPPQYL